MTNSLTVETTYTPQSVEWRQAPSHARQPAETSAVPLVFLRRLAADAELRSELEAAPAATLARHGIRVAEDAIPAAVHLPSGQELESALRQHASSEDKSSWIFYGGFLGDSSD